MSETRLENIIDPEVFATYTLEPSIYKSRFFKSGAIVENPAISGFLAGGGTIFTMPFFQDITGTSGDVPSETVADTVNNITSGSQMARRQLRVKAWGANDISAITAGTDPISAIETMATNYWANAMDMIAIASCRGVIADNIANDSGSLVNDISGGTGAAAIISDSAINGAMAKLGSNGIFSNDVNGGGYDSILMHSATYWYLRGIDAIEFVPISGQPRPLEFYQGMNVIVDDNAYVNTGVYDTYILKRGALEFGQSSTGYTPVEMFRKPGTGFGTDELYTRKCFALHPYGTKWTENTVTGGISPSDANLALAANWDRVYNTNNMKIVVVRHKLA